MRLTKEVMAASQWVIMVLELSTNKVAGEETDQFNLIMDVPGISGGRSLDMLRDLRHTLVHDPINSVTLYKIVKNPGPIVNKLCSCCAFLEIPYTEEEVRRRIGTLRDFHKRNKEVRW